jgi:hypothetical protein
MRSAISCKERKALSVERSAACRLAIMLMSQFPDNRCRLSRKNSRTIRFILFRLTARPTFLVTVMPIRDLPCGSAQKYAMKFSFWIFRPDFERARYSRLRKILSAFVKVKRNRQTFPSSGLENQSESGALAGQTSSSLGSPAVDDFSTLLGRHSF